MKRRSLLLGLGASLFAPMVVKAEFIMPVKKPIVIPFAPSNYIDILAEMQINGLPIPTGIWMEIGAAMSSEIQSRVNRSGFMRHILGTSIVTDTMNVPRIRVKRDIKAKLSR